MTRRLSRQEPKAKISQEAGRQYNSPWNIAARFNIDMSFSAGRIGAMLWEYEEDQQTGMDIDAVSECIYGYTSGYPYLVSAICKILDEEVTEGTGLKDSASAWTREGAAEAVV